MSIVKCPECGANVSDKATACPQCGCPTSRGEMAMAASVASSAPPCHAHPQSPAVGSCAQCGKTLCKECFDGAFYKINGKPICNDCTTELLRTDIETSRKQKLTSTIVLVLCLTCFIIGLVMWANAGNGDKATENKINAWIVMGLGGLPTVLKTMFTKTPEQKIQDAVDDATSDDSGCSNMLVRFGVKLVMSLAFAPITAVWYIITNSINIVSMGNRIKKCTEELAEVQTAA